MCGIVGIIGQRDVAPHLVNALKSLEYRGYDSSGIATLEAKNLNRARATGKLVNLEATLSQHPLKGHIGIGHTRWATHGAPNEANAHPHKAEGVAVVHNGIIENYRELRLELEKEGCVFTSQTDTETIAHLVSLELKKGKTPQAAVQATLPRLKGAFALAFLFEGHDELLIGARKGSPLVVGFGENEMYLGSDAIALAPFTNKITYLEEGDMAVLTTQQARIQNASGFKVKREVIVSQAAHLIVDKGQYKHYMLKEMHEQPEVVQKTLSASLDMANEAVKIENLPFKWEDINSLSITACGTAYYAGLIAKYWFEKFARLPVEIDVASEFRYRDIPLRKDQLSLFVSQSGETADTLASLRYCKEQGTHTLAVVNVVTSTIARECEAKALLHAGPEIGVASTKAFTCQLSVLICLAIAAGRAKGTLSRQDEIRLVHALSEVPRLMNETLKIAPAIEKLAKKLAKAKDAIYLGRGTSFPLAMEGALKLKEISYIHAEGYAAGELKHGPIALIDEEMPVIVVAPKDAVFEKTVSNMQEVAARGGKIILVTDAEGLAECGVTPVASFVLPAMISEVTPLVYALPLQMLAYYTALAMGKDVDQPRNLAKSVTVE